VCKTEPQTIFFKPAMFTYPYVNTATSQSERALELNYFIIIINYIFINFDKIIKSLCDLVIMLTGII
jgi:hypothetical protein